MVNQLLETFLIVSVLILHRLYLIFGLTNSLKCTAPTPVALIPVATTGWSNCVDGVQLFYKDGATTAVTKSCGSTKIPFIGGFECVLEAVSEGKLWRIAAHSAIILTMVLITLSSQWVVINRIFFVVLALFQFNGTIFASLATILVIAIPTLFSGILSEMLTIGVNGTNNLYALRTTRQRRRRQNGRFA